MSCLQEGQILVTGGAGFIGSALIWALNQRGYENILVSDYLGQDEKWKNLRALHFQDYMEADTLLEKLPSLDSVSAVFHLGACSATTERDCSYLIRNNFEYTKTLARWSLEGGRRFVYASSAATYGDGSQGMDDLREDIEVLRPLNMYGYSKHLFDLYAKRHGWLDQIVGMKYFNVFGPNEDHKGDMRSVVHKAYHQIRTTGRVSLFKSYHPDYKNGEQMRDFLYVKDAVQMTIFLAETPAAKGLFNLGSGEANTWLSLVRPIFKALNLPEAIDFVEMPETLRGKYQYYTKADIHKLRQAGYKAPITPLADAVTDYVSNYLETGKKLGD